ncbi:hypothetical protein I3760_14G129000 [Carya illinoinensis]|nr:hypothetical protein I3760_14G129000 [Carya illinoinensis]
MSGTGIEQLWKAMLVVLQNLKILDLSYCKNLIEIPDLTGAQNLKEINFTGCISLREVHPSIKALKKIQQIRMRSTGIKQLWKGTLVVLQNLKILELSNCKNLIEIPDLAGAQNLEKIYFTRCTSLCEVHPSIKVLKQIQMIIMVGTGIKQLWKGTLVVLENLKYLILNQSKNLIEIPDLSGAPNLEEIDLTDCTSLCEVHPSIYELKRLKYLFMSGTGIKQLWKGTLVQVLHNLKSLDLSNCKNLIEIPDLTGAQNLEEIYLTGCTNLCEIHPSIKVLKQIQIMEMDGTGIKQLWTGTLAVLHNLKILNLSNCKNMIEIPDLTGAQNLEEIYLTGCINLCEIHPSIKVLKQIQKIVMHGTGIKQLWTGTLAVLHNLKSLDLRNCKNLMEIPDLTGAQNLEEINLTGCTNLREVHPSIKDLKQIQKIIMIGTGIKQIWTGTLVQVLHNLKSLDLSNCKNLIEIPDLTGAQNLEEIYLTGCTNLCEIHPSIYELKRLKYLDMSGTGIKQLWKGTLVVLHNLKSLDLSNCKNLIEIPDLTGAQNLEEIYLTGCTNLCEIHPSIKVLKQIQIMVMDGTGIKQLWTGTLAVLENLKTLNIRNCKNLIEIPDLSGAQNLELIELRDCTSLCEVHPSIYELKRLKYLFMSGTGIKQLWKGTLVQVLHNLKSLDLSNCKNLIEIPDLTGAQNLEEIYLTGCTNLCEIHPSIKVLKQIQIMEMDGTGIKQLWTGTLALVLHNLKSLDLRNCKNLMEIPDLTGAQNLEEINLTGCTNLREVHPSIKDLKQIQKIIMIGTGIKQIWTGTLVVLENLKILNLSNCNNLIEIPDLSGAPNLEIIELRDCTSLCEVHPSIYELKRLKYLFMSGTGIKQLWTGTLAQVLDNLECLCLGNCKNLIEIPDLSEAPNLEIIQLRDCTSLCKVHPSIYELKRLKYLGMSGTGIKQLWKGTLVQVLHNLKSLDLSNCKNLMEIPDLTGAQNLEEIYLTGCINLCEIHPSIKVLKQIQKIVMHGTGIKQLWTGTLALVLHNLKSLDLRNCKNLMEIPDLTGAQNLEEINLTGCTNLREVHPSIKDLKQIQKIIMIGTGIKQIWTGTLVVLENLKILNLSNCNNLIEIPDLSGAPNLEIITLRDCTSLCEVHPSIYELKRLKYLFMFGTGIKQLWTGTLAVLDNLNCLSLGNCKNLIEIPDLSGAPNLEIIQLRDCTSLCEVHPSIYELKRLRYLGMSGTGIKQLWKGTLVVLHNLKSLDLSNCKNLMEIPDLTGAQNLEEIYLTGCINLCEIHPSIKVLKQIQKIVMHGTGIKQLWTGTLALVLHNLKSLDLRNCKNLMEIPDLTGAQNLEEINLTGCTNLREVHPSIKDLKQIQKIIMIGTGIKQIWTGTLVVLENLKILNLSNCNNLIEIPDLSGAPNLEIIELRDCTSLCEVHPSIYELKRLKYLFMSGTGIKQLWTGTLAVLDNLECLCLCNCKNLIEIPDLSGAPNLEEIYLTGCINLCEIHPSI